MEQNKLEKEAKAMLRLFKGVLSEYATSSVPNARALKYGVYISDSVPEVLVDEAIKLYGRSGDEANQTFHKSLFKVATAELEELYLTQMVHYLTTYGAEMMGAYNEDNVFVPREKLEIPELEKDIELVVIRPMSSEYIKERIRGMITINLALSKQTVRDIVELSDYIDIKEYSNGDSYFSKVKNKEVKTALCGKLGILPKRADEFLRYFLAKLCDKTLLINDPETIRAISFIEAKDILDLLNRYDKQYTLKPLAESFNRFKPFFLAMKRHEKETIYSYYSNEDKKHYKELNKMINTISKLSKRYHKPMHSNNLNNYNKWLDEIRNLPTFHNIVEDELKAAGIYNNIKLVNYMNMDFRSGLPYSLYKVRNGRIYIKDDREVSTESYKDITMTADPIYKQIRNIINDDTTIYIPDNIDYKLPQSEKQFVGNIPFGTKISFDKQSLLVGIHWCNYVDENNIEHRVDLDLHLTSNDYNIGWHSNYRKDNLVLFTGDNTNAPLPLGASEFMYIDNNIKDTTFSLKINNYTRDVGPIPYEIIIGVANENDNIDIDRNFVIDPNNIIAKIPMEMELGKAEQVIGVLNVEGDSINLIFTDMTTSDSRVSNNKEFERKVRNFVTQQEDLQMSLKDALLSVGVELQDKRTKTISKPYVMKEDRTLIPIEEADKQGIVYTEDDIYYKNEEVPVDFDFSLESLTKDSFIRLLQGSTDNKEIKVKSDTIKSKRKRLLG